ncbi:MAG: TolC family protein [Acidobacteria bacterium]|nr:TolC family protein [Acidobacteriota bacterium]
MCPSTHARLLAPLVALVLAATVAAQDRAGVQLAAGSPFRGGVPTGAVSPQPIPLSIGDAIRQALDRNLGVLQADERVDRARGARWDALSRLLPHLSAGVTETRRKTSLEVFGFPLRGEFPRIVGPFNVFDARLFASQALVDRPAALDSRAEAHNLEAARQDYRSARDLVVLVSANLYLEALAASARVETARAQRDTAEALYRQAQDLRQSGIIAGLDVVRAEVRLSADRQRATAAMNEFQKAKLQLARVIGLPIGQEFTLSSVLPTVPVPDMRLDEALERAYRERPDVRAAAERVSAAETARRAVSAERLPSVNVNADYGAIGLTAASTLSTFAVTGTVNVPIFEGGRIRARLVEADADLRHRRMELEDLRAEIYYEVRSAFLDLQATGEELETATRARELAGQQLAQSRDRFAAGVASNIEVVQAQEAVTLASEQYIGALYGFNVSKALLARSLGAAETTVGSYLGGAN